LLRRPKRDTDPSPSYSGERAGVRGLLPESFVPLTPDPSPEYREEGRTTALSLLDCQ
jgi:hypothetical protein